MLGAIVSGWRSFAKSAVLVLLWGTLGCSGESGDEAPALGPDAGPETPASEFSISLEPEALTLFPGQKRILSITVRPAGTHRVRLALLGDSRDAFVDRSSVDTDSAGHGEVALTAPAEAATFSLRASLEGAQAVARIAVSETGFADITVEPQYAGMRSVEEWIASAHTQTSCDELKGSIKDGSHVARAPYGASPTLRKVPVGPMLTVTVRAGQYASGCVDLVRVLAAEHNKVSVTVLDRPLLLRELEMDLQFDLERSSAFDMTLNDVFHDYLQAWRADGGSAANDVELLLNAMAAELDTMADSAAFAAARQAQAWDAAVERALGGPSPITARLRAWRDRGLSRLYVEPVLAGHLQATGSTGTEAFLELTKVAGLDTTLAGFPVTNLISLAAEPDDNLRLGANIPWLPNRLLAALTAASGQQVTGEPDLAKALAADLSCQTLAETAVAADSATPTTAFSDCSATCVENLCGAALATLERAALSRADRPGRLELTGAGRVTISFDASPEGWNGLWVGSIVVPELAVANTSGAFEASSTR